MQHPLRVARQVLCDDWLCAAQAAVCSVHYLDSHYCSSVKPAAVKSAGVKVNL